MGKGVQRVKVVVVVVVRRAVRGDKVHWPHGGSSWAGEAEYFKYDELCNQLYPSLVTVLCASIGALLFSVVQVVIFVHRRGGVVGMRLFGWFAVYTSLGFLCLSNDFDFFCYVADMTRS